MALFYHPNRTSVRSSTRLLRWHLTLLSECAYQDLNHNALLFWSQRPTDMTNQSPWSVGRQNPFLTGQRKRKYTSYFYTTRQTQSYKAHVLLLFSYKNFSPTSPLDALGFHHRSLPTRAWSYLSDVCVWVYVCVSGRHGTQGFLRCQAWARPVVGPCVALTTTQEQFSTWQEFDTHNLWLKRHECDRQPSQWRHAAGLKAWDRKGRSCERIQSDWAQTTIGLWMLFLCKTIHCLDLGLGAGFYNKFALGFFFLICDRNRKEIQQYGSNVVLYLAVF